MVNFSKTRFLTAIPEDLLNRESQWQISDTSSSFASLNYQPAPLNPPQPNTPSWATYHQAINALSCSVDPRHTPPERINSSTESTPNIPPPPTPLQSAVGTPGGMMDNEDKIQRNTLACELPSSDLHTASEKLKIANHLIPLPCSLITINPFCDSE